VVDLLWEHGMLRAAGCGVVLVIGVGIYASAGASQHCTGTPTNASRIPYGGKTLEKAYYWVEIRVLESA
jgi:hypothetical protein